METATETTESVVDHVNLTSEYDATLQSVVEGLNRYGLPAVIGVGIVGNSVSFIVYSTSSLRHQSSSVYLAFLNMVDLLFLLCTSIIWLGWLRVYIIHTHGWCQLVVYLSYVTGFLSVWTVVSFTVERCIVVYFPLARLVHCTRQRALMVVGLLGVVGLGLYACALWTTGVLKVRGRGNACLTLPEYKYLADVIANVDTVITLVLPSLLIILLNILITQKIWRTVRLRGDGAPLSSVQVTAAVDRSADDVIDEAGNPDGACDDVDVVLQSDSSREQGETEGDIHFLPHSAARGPKRIALTRMRLLLMTSCCKSSRRRHSRTRIVTNNVRRPTVSGLSQHTSYSQGSQPQRSGSQPQGSRSQVPQPQRSGSHGSQPQLRRHHTHSQSRQTSLQLSTTRTLLIVSSLFVLLNLPSHAFRVYVTVTYLLNPAPVFSRDVLLWQQVFVMMYYANFSSNFFLYCACSRAFRKDLVSLVTNVMSRCSRCRKQPAAGIASTPMLK